MELKVIKVLLEQNDIKMISALLIKNYVGQFNPDEFARVEDDLIADNYEESNNISESIKLGLINNFSYYVCDKIFSIFGKIKLIDNKIIPISSNEETYGVSLLKKVFKYGKEINPFNDTPLDISDFVFGEKICNEIQNVLYNKLGLQILNTEDIEDLFEYSVIMSEKSNLLYNE